MRSKAASMRGDLFFFFLPSFFSRSLAVVRLDGKDDAAIYPVNGFAQPKRKGDRR
jgi:hypothetical protein